MNHLMTKNETIMKMKQLRRKNGRMMELKQARRNSDLFLLQEHISHDTHLFVVLFDTVDPRQYYPNYRRPFDAFSTSQALPPWRYEDLPLQAIRRPRPLSAGKISDGTPSLTVTSHHLYAMRIGDSSSE
ncbi:hypothetical protein RDI58_014594 [Solanum bulbocastanum]|uniref:Uncharacterized protein n=1 Tax=Solanum bulbocastanum TaxID=147425 RepID=A0AAN8YAR0_SOLBU